MVMLAVTMNTASGLFCVFKVYTLHATILVSQSFTKGDETDKSLSVYWCSMKSVITSIQIDMYTSLMISGNRQSN